MLEQAQHAQQAEAHSRRQFESEKLEAQSVHSAEVVAMRSEHATALEDLQDALQDQQQRTQQMQSGLLERYSVLEKRFNAR